MMLKVGCVSISKSFLTSKVLVLKFFKKKDESAVWLDRFVIMTGGSTR
jgi:hypothetical protein